VSIFSHFRGVRISRGVIHFPHTGTDIKINKAFIKSAWAVTIFNSYLVALRIWRFFTAQRLAKSISFYPQPSGPWYNAWLAARMAGLDIVADPAKADHVFIFHDATYSDIEALDRQDLKGKVLNGRITDISKSHVGKIFKDVFGYSVDIDPLKHIGPAVQKSDINATHDGEIVTCPLSPSDIRAECVYQKLIDSTHRSQMSEDLRLAIVDGDIPVIFHKYKIVSKRFGTDYAQVDVKDAVDVFSLKERSLILSFCEKIGLDFGAIDVMRDKHDGCIYIVDVNKTCMPVLSLTFREQLKSFRHISQSLLRALGLQLSESKRAHRP